MEIPSEVAVPPQLHSRAQPSQAQSYPRSNSINARMNNNNASDNTSVNNTNRSIASIFTARNVRGTENVEEGMQNEFDNIDRVQEHLNEDRYNASVAEITQNVCWRVFIIAMLHMSWFGLRYFYAGPSSKMFVASDGSSSDAETTQAILLYSTEINFWKEFMNSILYSNYLAAWEPFGPLYCVLPLLDICIALLEFFTSVMMSNNFSRFIREYETAEFINRTSNSTSAIHSSHSPHNKNNVNIHATSTLANDPTATSSPSTSTRHKASESESVQLERPLKPVRSNYHSIELQEELFNPTTTLTMNGCSANDLTGKRNTLKKYSSEMEKNQLVRNLQSQRETSHNDEREAAVESDIVIVNEAHSHANEHDMKGVPLGTVCNEYGEHLEVLNYDENIMYDTCTSAELQQLQEQARREWQQAQRLLHFVHALRLFVISTWHWCQHIYNNTNSDTPLYVQFVTLLRRLPKMCVTILRECVIKVDAKYRVREFLFDEWRPEMFVLLPDTSTTSTVITPQTQRRQEQRE